MAVCFIPIDNQTAFCYFVSKFRWLFRFFRKARVASFNFWSIAALVVFLAGIVSSAHADIYQYVDENGVVNFTNAPSSRMKKPAKVLKESKRPAASSTSLSAARADRVQQADTIPVSYVSIINSACSRFGVDPSLVHAIVKVESDFNPFAISRKGAMGLMQLMPETASVMNVRDSFSPHENIEGGVKYLRYLLDRYEGNLSLALAAYNAGETSVKKWGTIPPFKETQDYVKKILQIYNGTGNTLNGGGKTFAPRYTIYVGTGADGTILFTDNPSSHPDKKLHHKDGMSL
jgi:soluble lytic murein transglycosylase-like protein